MSVEIINLDSLVPEDQIVKIKGREIIIPGDSSLEYALKSIRYAQELQNNPMNYEMMEAAFGNMYDEIAPKNPGLEKDEFRRMMTSKQYSFIIQMLYGAKQSTEKKTVELPSVEQREA